MRRLRDDSGSMLVEMLVGMILMGVVGTLVTDAIVSGFSTQRQLQDRGEALEETRRVVQRVGRDIRASAPVIEAHADSLSVQKETGSGTVTRTWAITTTDGVRSLTQTTTIGSGTPTTVTMISDLEASTTNTFTYAPVSSWSAVSGIDSSTCQVTGQTPPTYSQSCIGRVTLTLTRQVRDHGSVETTATIDVRNAT